MRFTGVMFFAALLLFVPHITSAKERQAVVTVQVSLKAPFEAKNVRLWIPYPMSDENQNVTDVHVKGNYSSSGVYRESRYKNNMLYAEWNTPSKERVVTYSFAVKTKERVAEGIPGEEGTLSEREMGEYLAPTHYGPTQGKVKETAKKIVEGKTAVRAKARAIYDWIVDNMHRDPNVKGCGFGEVERLLVTKGGKCTDIHSVYVALARAAGIPAREIFGIRIPKGKEGDMTKAQHCWAEFYLPGYGWFAVDPADVQKIILEKNIPVEMAGPYREYYFGAVDENRIAFGIGRDMVLAPAQSGEPLNYFMYPYAEANGKPLNEDLYGFNIGYKISFKEL